MLIAILVIVSLILLVIGFFTLAVFYSAHNDATDKAKIINEATDYELENELARRRNEEEFIKNHKKSEVPK